MQFSIFCFKNKINRDGVYKKNQIKIQFLDGNFLCFVFFVFFAL